MLDEVGQQSSVIATQGQYLPLSFCICLYCGPVLLSAFGSQDDKDVETDHRYMCAIRGERRETIKMTIQIPASLLNDKAYRRRFLVSKEHEGSL